MGGSSLLRRVLIGTMIGSSLFLTACDPVAFIANQSLRFVERNLVPPILSQSDTNMVCQSGTALAPLIEGTENIGANADQLSTLLYVTAGSCAEATASENELRYLRASHANQVEEAQDARIAQKHWAEVAARRQYNAYQHFEQYYQKKYDIKIGEQCNNFKSDFDQLVYLLGIISGLQALVNDITAQQVVGVPMDIAAKAERAVTCLDNKKWWGAPLAIRAVVWNVLPGGDTGKDPWGAFQTAMKIGDDSGVRLAQAMYAISAAGKDDKERMRDAIRRYALEPDTFKVNPKYRVADALAGQIVQALSDRLWTEATGTRTPVGQLGHFWDDKSDMQSDGVSVDDLLK